MQLHDRRAMVMACRTRNEMKRELQPVDFIMKDPHSGFRTLKIWTWMRPIQCPSKCQSKWLPLATAWNTYAIWFKTRGIKGPIHMIHDLKTGPSHAELLQDQ